MATNQNIVSRVTDYASRLITIVALAWFGLIAAENIESFSQPAQAELSSQKPEELGLEFNNLMQFGNGYWNFDGSAGSVQRLICSDAELKQRLGRLVNVAEFDTAELQDASRWVSLARAHGVVPQECSAGWCWTLDQPELQMRLITTDTQTPQLVAAALATADDQRWHLTILGPQRRPLMHLLPNPSDAETLCTRSSEDGRLQFELFSTTQSSEQLLSVWRSAGWTVQKTAWGTHEDFSYLCYRSGDAVYAWSESAFGQRTIMLSAADRQNPVNLNNQENLP